MAWKTALPARPCISHGTLGYWTAPTGPSLAFAASPWSISQARLELTLDNATIVRVRGSTSIGRRLFSAKDPASSLQGGQCHKAAQTPRLKLRGLFDQLALLKGVVRKHFGSQRPPSSAPGRNIVPVVAHRKTMVAPLSSRPHCA